MKDNSSKKVIWQRSRVLMLIAFAACMFAVGVTVAYMFKKSDTVDNQIIPAQIGCSVEETYRKATGVKSGIKVKNEGNVASYVRLKLVSYWQDAAGNVVGKPSELEVNVNESAGWRVSSAGTSDVFYYYTSPVVAGEETPSLLKSAIQLQTGSWQDDDGNSIPVYQVVDVFAEAIQSEPVSAVNDAWGVSLSADEGADITQ